MSATKNGTGRTLVGTRIVTKGGDSATVVSVTHYPRGMRRLIVRWDDSPSVVQGSRVSYHSKYGNSVWAHDVGQAAGAHQRGPRGRPRLRWGAGEK